MASTTPNLALHKIDLTDAPPDITVLNQNWDIIDEQVKTLQDDVERQSSDYLPLSGGTVSGTLILSKVMDADGDSYTSPALVVGGTASQAHVEIDNNEVQAKLTSNEPGNLFLNSNGGLVSVGEGGIKSDGEIKAEAGIQSGGAVYPQTSVTTDLGTAKLPWNNAYSRYFNVYGGAEAQYARLRVGTTGTTSTEGTGTLELGNATASGTAHNASGKITMYGSGTGFTNILPNGNTSGSNSVTLPTATGSLAVVEASTTDLTAGTSTLATGKIYLVY